MDIKQRSEEWGISPEDIKLSTEVLKEGQAFLTCLPSGMIPGTHPGELGLYYQDTRFLSCLEFQLGDTAPILLSSSTTDSYFAQIELTNHEIVTGTPVMPLHTLHLRIFRVLKQSLFQRLRVTNFNDQAVEISLKVLLGADYRDIFEVRGLKRVKRGELRQPEIVPHGVLFCYLGLDGKQRSTEIWFSQEPRQARQVGEAVELTFTFKLPPKEKVYLYMTITPIVGEPVESSFLDQPPRFSAGFGRAARELRGDYSSWKADCTRYYSDNRIFNQLLNTYTTDLRALTTNYPGWGRIIEAGIPWYSAPFGRDALVTSWQTLSVNTSLARDCLRFLAGLQATEKSVWKDATPGKILHEIRFGEMASAGEVPHTPYYGSVDSTLWFIILFSEYYRWTEDYNLVVEMAQTLERCLEWCRVYGDRDGDGYIEYLRESDRGLVNQGWKDSWDGIVDRHGHLPDGAIALVEVQAYYHLALLRMEELFRVLGEEGKAQRYGIEAGNLRDRFIKDFWLEDEGFLAFALDGKKKQVACTVSNAGHCLFTGILTEDLAHRVITRLFEPDMFSGWGIRTMSKRERPYNPMSYHNGSVWPHENAIIARGLRRYGAMVELMKVIDSMYQAAKHFPYHRLPELFCGFTRRGLAGPVKFLTACDPQAWAVGSMFQLVQTMLGIEAQGRYLHVRHPVMPQWINELVIENMKVGTGLVDLEFARKKNGRTYCSVLRTEGQVKVIIEP